jgi:protein-S-isoprenylcysteine O-methyltransferase Ste14
VSTQLLPLRNLLLDLLDPLDRLDLLDLPYPFDVRPFRPARPAPMGWNVTKTLVYVLLFWFVFLFVLPIGISIVEVELGIQRFPPQTMPAAVLLLAFTIVALWASVTLAVAGRGTPAPFDGTREFVTQGPYSYVRHPLVAAATGQGVGIGLALGSVPVLVYVTMAFVVWYFAVRPAEERDLAKRFGQRWRDYKKAVRAFRPRLTPYKQ